MGGCESVGGIPEDTSLTFSVFGPNDTLRHKCHARIPRPESDPLRRRGHASCQPRKSPSSAPRVIFASSPLDVHFSLLARSLLRLIEGRKDIESPHMRHFRLAPSGSLLLVTSSLPLVFVRSSDPILGQISSPSSAHNRSLYPKFRRDAVVTAATGADGGRETQYSKGAPDPFVLCYSFLSPFSLAFPAPRRHHIINTLAAPWSFHFALSTHRLRVTLARLLAGNQVAGLQTNSSSGRNSVTTTIAAALSLLFTIPHLLPRVVRRGD